ncbi:MAG TPA: MraY family glycosyltransferase [Verrucomicrobiae bacterium]
MAFAFALVAIAVSIVAPATLTTPKTRLAMVLGSMAMFGLGFRDDLRPLGAKKKLLGQILVAAAVYFSGIQIDFFKVPFGHSDLALGPLSFVATIVWLVMLTNLINLIDGIDGLAGGISFMLMCLLANVGMGVDSVFTTLLSAGTAGAILGFLYYNFPPAKIYMGDGGAYLLGFLIGVLSIVNSHKGSVAAALLAPVFALALPIADVMLAIVRRGLKGLPLFRPDRKHIHHRLLDFGLSRQKAVFVLYAVSMLCLLLAFGVFWLQGRLMPLLLGSLFLIFVATGRSFGFVKGWRSIAKSFALREETRYALALGSWFEMEAERRDSVSELWEDYQFIVRKLGFASVKLTLANETKIWWSNQSEPNEAPASIAPADNSKSDTSFVPAPSSTSNEKFRLARHEMSGGTVIEFAGDAAHLPDKLFELMTELAAETWQKAAGRWQEINKAPLRFMSVASPDTTYFKRKQSRYSVPHTPPELWNPARNVLESAG